MTLSLFTDHRHHTPMNPTLTPAAIKSPPQCHSPPTKPVIRVSLSLSASNFSSQPSLSRHQFMLFSSTVLYQKIGLLSQSDQAKRQRSSKKHILSIILEKVLLTSTVFLSLLFPLLLIQSSINLSLVKVLLCFIGKKTAGGQGGGERERDQTALTSSICNLFYSFCGGKGAGNHPGFVFTVL